MTKRIFRSILLVAVAVLLLCLALIMGVLYRYFSSVQDEQLKAMLTLAAHGEEDGGIPWLESLELGEYRLTLISPDGTVLYDSKADAASMENHSDREEVREALSKGSGENERISATLTEKTLYRALLLPDGNVLRSSVTQSSVFSLLIGMLQPICIVLAVSVLLAALLAARTAKRTVEPLNRLDPEHPLENDAYAELSPLLTRLAQQQRYIDAQKTALKNKQNEFASITENMNEGLILLNEVDGIVSINPAAQRLFGTDADAVGQDLLTVERDRGFCAALDEAKRSGHGEASLTRDGRQYSFVMSRIPSDKGGGGMVILAFDATEKARSERQRREFTANVSHELKTPLQSILGSAELMENGLVPPEELPRFTGHIRTEAARLVTLIDDIIRLSQLDEGESFPAELLNLNELAHEVALQLGDKAAKRQVALTVSGSSVMVFGARRLLLEILYNLTDNALTYTEAGGYAHVQTEQSGKNAMLTVSDNGIGIPNEQQERVFERFYRVDKSHSKETGGTGLGLSIVKHAVQTLGGEIRLESAMGSGTTMTVTLPGMDQ